MEYAFLDQLKKLPFIEAIWLYGSRARGNARTKSDIDLAIISPRASEQEWQQVLDIVDQADTLLHIDCVRYDILPEGTFKQNIDSNKKILYQRK